MKLSWPPTLRPRWNPRLARRAAWAGAMAVLAAAPGTCSPPVPLLTRVHSLGILRVATLNSPTTYYVGPAGPTGFEYDLTRSFAHDLGLEVEIQVVDSPSEILDAVRSGRAHLGAGLAVTTARERVARFTPPLRTSVPQLIYRNGRAKPKSLYELDGALVVPADSAAADVLKELAAINPQLKWEETDDYSTEQLLSRVASGDTDYIIAPSDLVAINRRYYPDLRVAFSLSDTQNIAWAFAPGDESLYAAAVKFIERLDRRELTRITDRHFGYVSRVGPYGALQLATHTQTRLPRYRKAFEDAARRFNLDWRLLASVGYQESMWDPEAISPTGVRGLMQITTDTADFLNIENRLDPTQSIYGAARYLSQLEQALPPEIQEPDRTWMVLAAYNVGLGHLLDVREITAKQGGDPNRWVDVRNNLPLLTQPKWFRQTKHGYARGHEAVTYVAAIRSHLDMLTWITGGSKALAVEPAPSTNKPEKKKQKEEPLNINSPVL